MQDFELSITGFKCENSLYSSKIVARQFNEIEKGVFAKSPIGAGEIIGIQGGAVFSDLQYHNLSADLQRYPLQIADHCYLGIDDRSKFDVLEYLNHGCDPNIGIRGINIFVAMRDISAGEELRYDYSMSDTTDADTGGWICDCKSDICRKNITPEDWRSPELQKKYGNFFSQYILDKIRATIK